MKQPPEISTNPFDNDVQGNKHYMEHNERLEEDRQRAEESYSKFKEASSPVYKKEYRTNNPKKASTQQSTGIFGGRASGPTSNKSRRNPLTLTTGRGNKNRMAFGAVIARWSWMVTIFCFCCCKTSMLWAILNILMSLAGTYFHNKGSTQTGTTLGLLSLVSAFAMLFVMGFGASEVATQFFNI